MPLRCPKWAMLSHENDANSIDNSQMIRRGMKYLAFIGIGRKINISSVLGNNIPNAINNPAIAPEAPNVGVLIKEFKLLNLKSVKFWLFKIASAPLVKLGLPLQLSNHQ